MGDLSITLVRRKAKRTVVNQTCFFLLIVFVLLLPL